MPGQPSRWRRCLASPAVGGAARRWRSHNGTSTTAWQNHEQVQVKGAYYRPTYVPTYLPTDPPTDRPTDRLTYLPTDRPTDRLTYLLQLLLCLFLQQLLLCLVFLNDTNYYDYHSYSYSFYVQQALLLLLLR